MKKKLAKILHSLWQIILKTWMRSYDADVSILAESLSFETVLSLVPLLAVGLSVFKAFGGFEALYKEVEPFILSNFVAASGTHAAQFIQDSIARIQTQTLGAAGAAGLLYTSTRLFMSVEKAVRQVYHERSTRISLRRVAGFWLLLFLGPLAFAVALGAIGSKNFGLLKILPHNALAFMATFVGFLMINRLLPVRQVSWRSAVIASGVAAVGIVLAQTFYASITTTFLRYSKIYGSLASIPIFLLWILVLWWICLGGVALCATLEEKDTPTV